MRSILVVAPHADDAELGLGGYLHRVRKGPDSDNIKIRIGVVAYGDNAHSKAGLNADRRMWEAEKSARQVGAEVTFLRAAPDAGFNTVAHGKLVASIEGFIYSTVDPVTELFIPLPSFHEDHTATYNACIAALRPRKNRPLPKRVFAYEYPGHHWGPQVPATGKVYRTIDRGDLHAKVSMLRCYSSQWVSDEDAPGIGYGAVEHLAQLRGSEISEGYAELFYSVREID